MKSSAFSFQLSALSLGLSLLLAPCSLLSQVNIQKDMTGALTGGFNVGSGKTVNYLAGSTLNLNGVLAGTPTGGSLNLSAVTLTFGANQIPWASVSKTGSDLTDLVTRNFADLQNKPTTAAGYGITAGAALDALGAVATNGGLYRTAANTYAARTLTGTAGQITVTNGDGVSGVPTISLPSTITQATTFTGVVTATGSGTIGGVFYGTGQTNNVSLGTSGANQPFIQGYNNTFNVGQTLGINTSAGGNVSVGNAATVTAINGTTASTSTATGALTVAGGVGVAGAGNFGSTITVNNTLRSFTGANLQLGTQTFGTSLSFASATGVPTFSTPVVFVSGVQFTSAANLDAASSGTLSLKIGTLGATPSNSLDAFVAVQNTGGPGVTNGDLLYIPRSSAAGAHRWFTGNGGAVAQKMLLSNAGDLTVSGTTASTSTTTGSGIFGGGIGVAGAQFLGGNLTFGTSGSVLNGTTGSIGLTATGTNQSVTVTPTGTGYFKTTTSNDAITLQLASFLNPGATTAGRYNEILLGKSIVAGGAGMLGYKSDTATPANGRIYLVNYADNQDTKSLSVYQGTGNVVASSITASTSTTTGALTVAGGVGVAGAGYFGGNVRIAETAATYGLTARLRVDSPNTNTGPAIAAFGDSVGRVMNLYEVGHVASTTGTSLNFNAVTGTGFSISVGTSGGSVGGTLQITSSTLTALLNTTEATTGGAGSLTTAGGIYAAKKVVTVGGVTVSSTGTNVDGIWSSTATLDYGSISAAASADLTITVTGASTGDSVSLGLPSAPTAGIIFQGFVSATNTVTVRATNITGSPVDPASATYRATVTSF